MRVDPDRKIVLPVEDRVERDVVVVPAGDKEDAHGVGATWRGAERLLAGSPFGRENENESE
jgi:hypothetical protein